jgi:hypothetical protein
MKLSRIFFLLLLLFLFVPSASFAQSKRTTETANKTWDAFWSKFSTAVKNKNKATIKSLASSRFTWHDADDTVSAWLKNLDSSKLWYLVQNSVKKGTMTYDSGEKKPWQVTRDNHLLFVFENGSWRFYGIMGD